MKDHYENTFAATEDQRFPQAPGLETEPEKLLLKLMEYAQLFDHFHQTYIPDQKLFLASGWTNKADKVDFEPKDDQGKPIFSYRFYIQSGCGFLLNGAVGSYKKVLQVRSDGVRPLETKHGIEVLSVHLERGGQFAGWDSEHQPIYKIENELNLIGLSGNPAKPKNQNLGATWNTLGGYLNGPYRVETAPPLLEGSVLEDCFRVVRGIFAVAEENCPPDVTKLYWQNNSNIRR